MNTINVSLPTQLKDQADGLISRGYFASFSDLVRTALRKVISDSQYDLLANEALKEYRQGKATVMGNRRAIRAYLTKVTKK